MKYPIPRGNKRACLCRDGETYSIECCEEDYFSQGIGNITASFVDGVLQDSDGTIVQTDTSQSLGSTNTDPLPEAGLGVSDVTNEDTERSFTNSTDSTGDDQGDHGLPTTTTTTTTLPVFDCTDAVFSMTDGNSSESTSGQGSVTLGTINSISPSTYSTGSATYTATITVPSGYSNSGSTIDCTDTATGLVAFTCTDANFVIANGNANDSTSGQGTVSLGTITNISPSVYGQGTNTYTATITVPSGYSNSGQSINCTDDAFGELFGWFANAASEYDGFSTRSDACSGVFADSTSVRIHFKDGSGTLQYPSTTQNIIDGALSLLMFEDDGTGSPTSNKIRGGATFFGLVYKDVDDINTSTDPQLTLVALGSSSDTPPYSSEGLYNLVQTCSP
jgi:hypothetical protein